MKNKKYISFILIFIFLAKFGAIDANGLNFVFNGNQISFVKPNCKKKNSPKLEKKTGHELQTYGLSSKVFKLVGFCATQLQFQPFSWDISNTKPNTIVNEHLPSKLNYLYLEHISPPPRLV